MKQCDVHSKMLGTWAQFPAAREELQLIFSATSANLLQLDRPARWRPDHSFQETESPFLVTATGFTVQQSPQTHGTNSYIILHRAMVGHLTVTFLRSNSFLKWKENTHIPSSLYQGYVNITPTQAQKSRLGGFQADAIKYWCCISFFCMTIYFKRIN